MEGIQIEYLKTSNLKPYKSNARKHAQKDIEAIMHSITEFGFLDPVGIWGTDNTIVEGHGRLAAAKKLGMKEVPCIRLDSLTDEQRKAYCLAHNKTAELSGWEELTLGSELSSISIDMTQFGFELPAVFNADDILVKNTEEAEDEGEDEGKHDIDRWRCLDKYKLDRIDFERHTEKYQMPILEPCQHIPTDLIPFNYMLNTDRFDAGIHFYKDDYQFERLWNNPSKYLERLSMFDCVFTPDFSLYTEMTLPIQIWNIYRSKMIGQIMQDEGIKVIPTLQWCREDSYEWAFSGLPKHSVVTVSTIGVKREEEASQLWFDGMAAAMKALQPSAVLVYGGDIGFNFGKTKVVYFDSKQVI